MTNVRGITKQRKGVLTPEEIEGMIQKAEQLKPEYFRLRAKAIMALGKTGKRRAEVATLEVTDLEIEDGWLYITFTVVKKRKKNVLATRRTKRFPLANRFAQYLVEYWVHMKREHPECKYLFPSVHSVFGMSLAFYKDKHISGRQLLRIVKQLNPTAWFHLFRDTRGAEIVKADERKHGQAGILTVYRVQRALDLEKTETAWNYINRYATETIEPEEEY